MSNYEIGKNNLIAFLKSKFPALNIADNFQSVPKTAVFPTVVVYITNVHMKPYVQQDVTQVVTAGTHEVYWGEEQSYITIEIIHNNRIARDNLSSSILDQFIKNGSLIYGNSVFTLTNHRIMDTANDVLKNFWLAVFHVESYSGITFTEDVNSMATIDLQLTEQK